jgi:hypothetical protein
LPAKGQVAPPRVVQLLVGQVRFAVVGVTIIVVGIVGEKELVVDLVG